MNARMLIQSGDKMEVVTRRADDGTNDGSIIIMRHPGHAYCIAKAPRYTSDAEWRHNAELIVSAIRTANASVRGAAKPRTVDAVLDKEVEP